MRWCCVLTRLTVKVVLTTLLYATTEGPWDEVMRLIGQAHTIMHEKGVVRVQTDIRVGTR
jgi:uncharacterized protein YqgV (UPF0045/DUF77 family)